MIETLYIKQGLTLEILNLNDFSLANNLKEKRDIETQGKLFLLHHLVGETCELKYNVNGKPYLANDLRHISVSHSYDKLVIIINEIEPTGIDIEIIRDKIVKIKHKFLSDIELKDAGLDIEKLLIYWCAKEALYKIHGLLGVDFINNLIVNSFQKKQQGELTATINLDSLIQTYILNYQIIENYILVYVLQKLK